MSKRFEDWVADAVGRGMNPDGAYGYQCKDVIDDYCLFLFGDWVNTIRPGDARECFDNANPDYFIKVLNDPSDPNQVPPRGSIVVINGAYNGGPGHIFVVENYNNEGIDAIEQNGYTVIYDGDDNVVDPGKPTYRAHYDNTIYVYVTGWLIPIIQGGEDVSKVGINEARILAYALGGRDGFDGRPNALNGESDDDLNAGHVGQETNDDIHRWYDSAEFEDHVSRVTALHGMVVALTDANEELQRQLSLATKGQPASTPLAPVPVQPPAPLVDPLSRPGTPPSEHELEGSSSSQLPNQNNTLGGRIVAGIKWLLGIK